MCTRLFFLPPSLVGNPKRELGTRLLQPVYCVDAQLNELDSYHPYYWGQELFYKSDSGISHMQLRCAYYVCIRGLQIPTMQLSSCNCCLDHILPSISTHSRLKWNPLNASTDIVIIYNSYISFLVYTVLDIAQCYIVCRCCYVQHMPIFEERESLGVKTLKSFNLQTLKKSW